METLYISKKDEASINALLVENPEKLCILNNFHEKFQLTAEEAKVNRRFIVKPDKPITVKVRFFACVSQYTDTRYQDIQDVASQTEGPCMDIIFVVPSIDTSNGIVGEYPLTFSDGRDSSLAIKAVTESDCICKHISEVKKGDILLVNETVLTAASDAYMTKTDGGKEWNFETTDDEVPYVYASDVEAYVCVLKDEPLGAETRDGPMAEA